MCGGHGWGGHRGGFGFFFPALLLGRLIAGAVEQSQRQPAWPGSQVPPAAPSGATGQPAGRSDPQPPVASATAAVCPGCRALLGPGFRFCPHCGRKLAPAACRYCGQALTSPARYCGACGAPQG